MKIYFVASILGKKRDTHSERWQKQIIKQLKDLGHEVWDGNFNTEPKLLYEESEDEYVNIYNRNTKIIKSSDLVIAEVSMSDSGVGYEISYALSIKKPVLALYNEQSVEPTAPPIIAGKSKFLTFVKYDEKNLKSTLDKYIGQIKKNLDSKFILIISSEIDRYLEWSSQENRMHKAQIVRDAIEKVMNKDTDYKKFLETA
ncbi:MAG TPA: nucleoside 2-deoxyribosyltransferase [Candidatus Dojkabacteria bacterium]|nr:nucleoside 2-deoxyribosyltransferase [Candidatus Dojkabacteria bacterium]HRO64985.1 nucleoside 2-deoxyribosyltransferase [Candidatus Dojkabacteria bacterium]HRP51810.1 nucleoside 2-deoxyribosyltransferase [Candidatus Dojkabacteria bacterium]